MGALGDAERESAAIQAERAALLLRLEALRQRPILDGEAVEAVWREQLAALEAEVVALDTRVDALISRVERAYTTGLLGFARRHHWLIAAIFGVVVPLVPVAIWSYGVSGENARLVYFEAAAQVIPVLVLALALQTKHFNWSATKLPTGIKLAGALQLLWLAAGEAAALAVVADGHASSIAFGLTTAALINAGVVLVLYAVSG